MKFGQFILRKIIKIVASRCQIFTAKMCQNRFPTRLLWQGELTALPKAPSWNKGDLLLRKGNRCREGEGRRGKGGERETRHTNLSLLLALLLTENLTLDITVAINVHNVDLQGHVQLGSSLAQEVFTKRLR